MQEKKCKLCKKLKPLNKFYFMAGKNCYTSRCKDCHGIKEIVCIVCGNKFIGKSCKKICSEKCKKEYRPQTFKICKECGKEFGPIGYLAQIFCSNKCKYINIKNRGKKEKLKISHQAIIAHGRISNAVKSGKIKKANLCQHCNIISDKLEAAHIDYNNPLDILWLCRSCHIIYDKKNPKGGCIPRTFTGQQAVKL